LVEPCPCPPEGGGGAWEYVLFEITVKHVIANATRRIGIEVFIVVLV